ncbi:unnamed protein product [Brassicogethes aeneus]|uniref:SAM domain-containing protein n=1 Tax=Brassicogethes aeneus TaxID=1431903 RepID=A0A9P0BEV5_BRAAE|nr:unnamed protein product [Brassicogethes aeneus]
MADDFVVEMLAEWGLDVLTDVFREEAIDEEALKILDEETINVIVKKSGLKLKLKERLKEFQRINASRMHENENSPSSSFVIPQTSNNFLIKEFVTIDNDKLIIPVEDQTLESLINSPADNIHSSTFVKAAEEICDLFVKEDTQTFYIPYCPKTETSPKIQPKGKLYSRYVNLKSAIKLSASSTSKIKQAAVAKEISDEEQSQIAFLRTALEPRDQILVYWQNTFEIRKDSNCNKSINEYLNLYPFLKLSAGYILLESDFDQIYPDKRDIIYTTFPKLAEAIIKEAEKKKVKLPYFRDQCMDSITDQLFLALLYLPYLFSPTTLGGGGKNKSKNWRPSKLEVQESFVLYISKIGFLNEKIEERKTRLHSLGLTVQPFIVCIGEQTITSSFVVIDDIKYKLETPIKALDVAFKVFHTVNAEYPAECQHVWLLIQRLVYNINTAYDKPSSATTALITDLNEQLSLIPNVF